jgi:hypothetical protein
VLEYGPLIALLLLLIWLGLLTLIVSGKIQSRPFRIASLFLGLMIVFFWLSNEITELTISKVGTIKTNVEQARTYLDEIKSIRSTIDSDERIIHAAAADAQNAKALVGELSAKNEKAAVQLQQVAENLEEATKVTERLKTAAEFTTTVLAAENNDRKSYDQLAIWANDSFFNTQPWPLKLHKLSAIIWRL